MKILAVILLPLLLVGCAVSPKVPDYKFPANLLVPCEELPPLDGDTLGDLYEYTVEIATLYNICAVRHDALSKAVNKPK